MATDASSSRSDYIRSVTVTALAAILGIVGAIGALVVNSSMAPAAIAQSTDSVLLLVVVIAVQIPLLKVSGAVEELSGKDILFIVFVTFSFWFVTLTILLTSGVSV